MEKKKKSKFIFIIFTILTIIVLLSLFPLIGSIDYFFGLKGSKNITIDGDVDVNVAMNVELNSGLLSPVAYLYYVEIDFTFNASVTDVEIERIDCDIYQNTIRIYTYNGTLLYWPKIISSKSIELSFGDNLTCQGSVDLNYQLNSNPQNGTVNYNLVYTHSIKEQDAHNFMLFENTIIIVYILSFFVLPIILFFIIHPDFREPSKKEKEKNEEYLDFLAKRKPKESNESSAKE